MPEYIAPDSDDGKAGADKKKEAVDKKSMALSAKEESKSVAQQQRLDTEVVIEDVVDLGVDEPAEADRTANAADLVSMGMQASLDVDLEAPDAVARRDSQHMSSDVTENLPKDEQQKRADQAVKEMMKQLEDRKKELANLSESQLKQLE